MLASSSMGHQYVGNEFGAETLACADALKTCLRMGLQSVIVEGDSLSVIKKARAIDRDRSIINPFIQDIQRLATCFNKVQFQHADRSKNALADNLEKEGLRISQDLYLVRSLSDCARSIQSDEALREPD